MIRKSRTVLIAATLAGATILSSACTSGTGPDTGAPSDSLTVLPRALSSTEQQAVTSGNQFAMRLLNAATARTTSGNVLLSPLSVSLALGMTMNGAAGTTLAEMQQTLGWGSATRTAVNVAYRDLMTLLPTLDPAVTVRLANGIWVRQPMVPDTGFTTDARRYFGAPVVSLPSPAVMFDSVNAWGRRETNGMIERVLAEPPSPDLAMLLANAVYVAGNWRERFDASRTAPAPFTLERGGTVTVPMMTRKGGFRAASGSDWRAVELPYGNAAYSMLAIVPTGAVSAFAASLDTVKLNGIVRALAPVGTSGELFLPKFKVAGSLELSPTLKALGMPRAFTELAEFPRFFGGTNTQLSFVQHSMVVDVDEHGTRAAGVTVVGVVVTSMPMPYRVDRPFVFAIRERLTGTILFLGVVRDPTAK